MNFFFWNDCSQMNDSKLEWEWRRFSNKLLQQGAVFFRHFICLKIDFLYQTFYQWIRLRLEIIQNKENISEGKLSLKMRRKIHRRGWTMPRSERECSSVISSWKLLRCANCQDKKLCLKIMKLLYHSHKLNYKLHKTMQKTNHEESK